VPEVVTEETLMATIARVADGVGRLTSLLHGGRSPDKMVGPACRWCPVIDTCHEGTRHLEELDDR
jgi:hypothetical protein